MTPGSARVIVGAWSVVTILSKDVACGALNAMPFVKGTSAEAAGNLVVAF